MVYKLTWIYQNYAGQSLRTRSGTLKLAPFSPDPISPFPLSEEQAAGHDDTMPWIENKPLFGRNMQGSVEVG